VSVAIKKALTNLDKAIDKMEVNLTKRPVKAKSGQPDLFAIPQSVNQPPANVIGFDRNALARKLDMTIAKVEQLLSEA
jgi:hypothetical protein